MTNDQSPLLDALSAEKRRKMNFEIQKKWDDKTKDLWLVDISWKFQLPRFTSEHIAMTRMARAFDTPDTTET